MQRLQRLADEFRQVALIRRGDPAFERVAEDREGRLGGDPRRRLGDAALSQGVGEGGGDRGELDELAFLELRVGRDDELAPSGEVAAVPEGGANPFQGSPRSPRAALRRRARPAPRPAGDVDRPRAAGEHFGWVAPFFALDVLASSALTRERLGWQPTHLGLIDDLEQGHYFRESAA